jgi:NTE family protein
MKPFWRKTKARRPRIGYALSGGAVRGAAHLGFLSVFEAAGIRPDLVAGTSAGSAVGAGYAAGLSVEHMCEIVKAATWREVTGRPRLQPLSVFATTPLREWLGDAMGDVLIEDLEIPFAAVACNAIDGETVVLRSGPLVEAVVASCAIPGLFAPVERGDMLLVDGGVLDNLPVDVARSLGADVVIAVDVSPLRELRRPENLRDMMATTVSILAHSKQVGSRAQADFLIAPKTEEFSTWDFARIEEIIESGRKAASTAVPQVLALLG